jgi:hypothetical protein
MSVYLPLTMTVRSKAWTVFVRSDAGIVGSNSTQGIDVWVFVYSVVVLSCVQVAALRRAYHSSIESYRLVEKWVRNNKRGQSPVWAVRTVERNLFIYLFIYSSKALCWTLAAFSVFDFLQSAGFFGRGSARRKAATCTRDNTNRINAHRNQCLKWDSNRRSQCLSERRKFMPETAGPLWLASDYIA